MSTTLLRIDASIRREGSVSRGVADSFEAEIQASDVVRRDLGTHPLPSDAWALSVGLHGEPGGEAQRDASALATTLADELVGADAVVLAAPLYNFGVPASVKAWIDLVLTDDRFKPGTTSPLVGRPAYIVVTRGGGYGEGTPREGWDHATGYLRRILGDVWGLDVHVIEAELTLAEVTPGMEGLRDLARQNLEAAHDTAREAGRTLTSVDAA